MKATISVMGLYSLNEHLFSRMVVPEAVDRDTVINMIMIECAELEAVYTDSSLMEMAIGWWCRSKGHKWKKLAETMNFEYNPIWNKDGEVIEERTGSSSADGTGKGDSVRKVSAFDSDDFENHDTEAGTNETHSDGSYTDSFRRIERGNIGVTTTQQMIQEERRVSDFSLYDVIVDDFKERFCLLVY